jgi:predicted permease
VAQPSQQDEVLGDLEEAHVTRVRRLGRLRASALTSLEALDMSWALLRERRRARRVAHRAAAAASNPSGGTGRGPAISWLDFKLGLRMQRKHPGLALVSGLGIAVAVAVGAVSFGVIHTLTASHLPLDDGEQVVAIQNARAFYGATSTPLHQLWRGELPALDDFGAYRVVTRNLISSEGQITPLAVAEMTASGFRIARVPPLLGRPLIEDDERPGAAPVVVIGHGLWRERFGESLDVLGQSLRLGATTHTIVGVMPADFAFPINHRVWTPLKLTDRDFERAGGPAIDVFGRLSETGTLGDAEAQLAALGQRVAAASPGRGQPPQPRVFRYAQEAFAGPLALLLYGAQLLVSMLLVVIAINVAVLFYARTATRLAEITLRTALGASRSRIATQLFIEALVLSTLAATLGLLSAHGVLQYLDRMAASTGGEQVPFWWDFGLSLGNVLYAMGLAVAAAVIIGVLPALRATGRHLRSGLQTISSGASAPKVGRVWTALIVGQVAVAVAVLPVALNFAAQMSYRGLPGPEAASREILRASLYLDREGSPSGEGFLSIDDYQRLRALQAEVLRRLESEPGISHVVAMSPAPWRDPDLRVEVEGGTLEVAGSPMMTGSSGAAAGWSRVETEFFDAFEIPVVAGRAFSSADRPDDNVVIVSRTFVDRLLGGGSAVGRRVRPIIWGEVREPGEAEAPWYTIVGVVPEFPKAVGPVHPEPKVYEPLWSADAARAGEPLNLAVRVRGEDPARFGGRLRQVAAAVDPMLRLDELSTFAEAQRESQGQMVMFVTGIGVISVAVLLLSLAGLYALMSFTVVRQRREIGIRFALGGRSDRILGGVLFRSIVQFGLGVVVGLTLTTLVDRATGGLLLSGDEVFILPAIVLLMTVVGALAAWGPARRALSIQPTEALRAE